MTPHDLSERLWSFAVRVAKVVDSLPDTRMGRHVAGQLCRSGTAAAPNYDEACAAESRADFVHKVNVAWKEQRETCGWLRFITRLEMLPSERMAPLIDEALQLTRILSSTVATARGKTKSARRRPNPQSKILNPQSSIPLQ